MTLRLEREQAAIQRRDNIGVTGRAARPVKRRCAEELNAPARAGARLRDLTIRDTAGSSSLLTFDGVATTYEQPYEMYDFWGPYTEVVSAGAAAKSLSRSDLDVPLVLQHADLRRIARTTNGSLQLSELDDGMHVHAPELDRDDADVAYIVPKLRAGLVDEMSFKFMITSGQWSPDYTEFRINEFDLHRGDVAIVGYGANPGTSGGIRSAKWSDWTPADLARMAEEIPLNLAGELASTLSRRVRAALPPVIVLPAAQTGISLAAARAMLELA